MGLTFYMFMCITLLFDIAGDYLAKRWSVDNTLTSMIAVILSYSISGILWGYSLRYGELSKGTLIINILNILVMIFVGVLVFNEDLSFVNKIGVVFGLVSIYLVSI